MAIINARYRSVCLNRFVSFMAILPFEQYGENYFSPDEAAFGNPEPMKTLYLLHGMTGDELDWIYGTRIAAYAEQEKIAVIMPNGLNTFYVDNHFSERYGEFIGRELVEATRGMFHLSSRREDTYIAGLSMGGYGAVRNGLKYSDTFSKIASLSGAMFSDAVKKGEEGGEWINSRAYFQHVFGNLEEFAGSDMDLETLFLNSKKDQDIFMAIGTEDSLLEKNRKYRDFLQKNGAKLTYLEEPGAHEWEFWDRNILRVLRWLKK